MNLQIYIFQMNGERCACGSNDVSVRVIKTTNQINSQQAVWVVQFTVG